MLNFFERHGMVVDKIHEIISFKQSKWLVKKIILIPKNEIKLELILKKISINYLLTDFTVKQWKM